jgi:hypothetical protein
MDWFNTILETGASAYEARESRKMEEAKAEQAALLNAAPKQEQPQAIPQDAKATAVAPVTAGGVQINLSPMQKTGLMVAGGLFVGLMIYKAVK